MEVFTVVLYDGTRFNRDAESVEAMREWLSEAGYEKSTSKAPASRRVRHLYRESMAIAPVGTRI